MELWPFKVTMGEKNTPVFDVELASGRKKFEAVEISGMILSHMKKIAEKHLNREVINAVVTVPAYFNDSQRCATIDAAKIAGLNVVRIINEPTAAALAFGLDKVNTGDGKKNVLIFDLGGGTLDVTVLEIQYKSIIVKAKRGHNHLGGQDFDRRLVEHFVEEFKRNSKKDMSKNSRALSKLKTKCEEVKRMLSTTFDQAVYIDSLYDNTDLDSKITRAKFEALNYDYFDTCIKMVGLCLEDVKLDKRDIDDVVLVGGSSRIPKIQSLLKEFLGIKSFCENINPDEAVAYGAAVQAAMLGGSMGKDIVLQDATPLSIRIERYSGDTHIAIPRNTTIPTSVTQSWSTAVDYSTGVAFNIYEGERIMAVDNEHLAEFSICDIPKKPKGEVSFTSTVAIDSNSILTVTAMENETGKTGKVTIHYDRGRLTKEERDRMVEEAEKYNEEDEKRRLEAIAKNELDSFIYDINTQIESRHITSQIDDETRTLIEQEVRQAMDWSQMNEYIAGHSGYREKKSSLLKSLNVIMGGLRVAGLILGFDTLF